MKKKTVFFSLAILLVILFNQILEIKSEATTTTSLTISTSNEGSSSTSNKFIVKGEENEYENEGGECKDNIGCGRNASRLILSFLFLILLSMLVIYVLTRINIHYIPESLAVVVYGIIIGIIIKYSNVDTFKHLASYNPNEFFLFILPLIIFETGLTLNKKEFFRNIKSILVLATIGTLIAFLLTGFGLYLLGIWGVSPKITLFESLLVSSISSATDPVATLGIFKVLDVDPTLFLIVLGESILNDAVSVILYDSVLQYDNIKELWKPVLLFFGISIGSVIIGVLISIILTLLLKFTTIKFTTTTNTTNTTTTDATSSTFRLFEIIFIIIISYSSYIIADSIYLSGILSSFFCGITSSHYLYKSLSDETKQSISQLFRMIAFIGETIVFIYIGLVLPNFNFQFNIKLLVWTFLLLLISRAISIFPTFFIINKLNNKNKLNNNKNNNNGGGGGNMVSIGIQIVIWVSGLRGAISFSLMEESEIQENVSSIESANLLKTDILMIVYSTLFIFGSLTYPILKLLKIKTDVSSTINKDSQDNDDSSVDDSSGGSDSNKLLKNFKQRSGALYRVFKYLIYLDNFLLNFFSNKKGLSPRMKSSISSSFKCDNDDKNIGGDGNNRNSIQLETFNNRHFSFNKDDEDYYDDNQTQNESNSGRELLFTMDSENETTTSTTTAHDNKNNKNNNNNDDE
ncbi:hypothetical protein DDB_G0281877 [Dictyostelium discoideum AX4]|uniref:Sodium/hydrogen exchanger n=1 Tax=Dictyostelium discoideum TaxID=44689 RepID=Q54TB5_DICDI|nr:hypothetical protein DDB_G0281877 [Dictyostelium discoideum AX4]ADV31333.1 Nhe2 [Dictyostelium discoideum]EAL66498.1 hypothetical protein DDB_G0281877 [Dictyostelium discoideum AX4]|eukprot:XP_640474.1 hypothetical protein DDB_G0281877 [Dictyostelium discoideum AX4]